ncbi:FAD-dependent oxidoreductase [Corynebacterium guangdongense]|uniref:NADPH-dependent 2,4-dienoyl-CoA reductase/sulfur reductase-like enzyme/rhodanese-related sulfurtransferase n=1 Tax=Corynebacterium guangdongense TaxID=1783348 RepID=A0ABU1ZU00_9CORY|nr:FAD-dependent oxidoreductase [Corynebacterium guangdongense]MDR7328409.1 NADPH-dependent 2,4-dienoyl-CoA reductase/sulfur reductase-like enzyme/rhodanese-related sulfurtransferase [Corynebacterium guangdongense]WJZ16986.1 Coenzyme A disulfide reductase [Corynebacterium guangdongense]
MTTTVIVGGVAGGMSTATRLRRRDEDMEIIVVEASGYVSFANCGLPYYVGGVIGERDELLLQTPESLKERFNLDVRVGTRAHDIDRAAKTIQLTGPEGTTTQAYDHLVLSPGASPVLPPIDGIERAYTLRTVEDVDVITAALDGVKKAVLIGGGFIGLELAENLTHRGVEVTVLEFSDQIMAPLDPEMAAYVHQHLEKNGVTVLTGADTVEIAEGSVTLRDGRVIDADMVVAAIGVRPASELASEAGLEVGERGGIVVDEFQRTADPAIFALGDAAEKRDAITGDTTLVPLAQTANRHGRLIADIITGRDVTSRLTLGTAIVGLFGLQAATVGWNEKRARAAGRDIRVVSLHPQDHAGYYPGASQIHLKFIIDAATDAILGAQAVGEAGADKRIDVIATAMRGGLTASDLADLELAYAPQFGSAKDPVNMAGFIADNLANGEKSFLHHELEQAVAEGWKLVDVRTPGEFNRATIPGAVNIPLDDIRDRFDEFEGEKVLAFCRVGQRGHTAVTLLENKGIEAANLNGGFLTWEAASSVNAV